MDDASSQENKEDGGTGGRLRLSLKVTRRAQLQKATRQTATVSWRQGNGKEV